MSAPYGQYRIEVRERYDEPAVVCNECDGVLCTVEHGDTVELLMTTATAHICETSTCRYCERHIVHDADGWVDPEADGDDSVWRETCDANVDDFAAEHEPIEEESR